MAPRKIRTGMLFKDDGGTLYLCISDESGEYGNMYQAASLGPWIRGGITGRKQVQELLQHKEFVADLTEIHREILTLL